MVLAILSQVCRGKSARSKAYLGLVLGFEGFFCCRHCIIGSCWVLQAACCVSLQAADDGRRCCKKLADEGVSSIVGDMADDGFGKL